MKYLRRLLALSLLLPACGSDDAAGESLSPDAGTDAQETSDSAPEADPDVGADTDAPDAADAGEADAGEADSGPQVCGTGNRALPDGLTELAWDDGTAAGNLRGQSWEITVNGNTYVLGEHPLYEAMRFELEHPARIHGFSVQWAALDDSLEPSHEVFAGLYADFGYNGFDFWQADPLWQGS
ncbi:MAG: hypothetical protein ACOC1F_13020, partial [Myxococcota bacterium]